MSESASTKDRSNMFSADWCVSTGEIYLAPPTPDDNPVKILVALLDTPSDVPPNVSVVIDRESGHSVFAAAEPEFHADVTITAHHRDAMTLFLGDPEQQRVLFERGALTIDGNFTRLISLESFAADPAARERREVILARTIDGERLAAPPTASLAVASLPSTAGRNPHLPLDASATFSRSAAVVNNLIDSGEIVGGQVVASIDGTRVVEWAFGEARPGAAMTERSLPPWYCCTKPLGAVAIEQLVEKRKLALDAPVADYLSWFADSGKGTITTRHLLTHTAAIPFDADPVQGCYLANDDEIRRRIAATQVDPSRVGTEVNYGFWWSWFVLADIVQAITGSPYADVIRANVQETAGMSQTHLTFTDESFDAHEADLAFVYDCQSATPRPTSFFTTRDTSTKLIPAAGARGPMRDLAGFFETLLASRRGDGSLLSPASARELTTRCRTGLREQHGVVVDWALGFEAESRKYDPPRSTSFSTFCSDDTFGHKGLGTTFGFADPETGLVVAAFLNGQAIGAKGTSRSIELADALHHDLGLV